MMAKYPESCLMMQVNVLTASFSRERSNLLQLAINSSDSWFEAVEQFFDFGLNPVALTKFSKLK